MSQCAGGLPFIGQTARIITSIKAPNSKQRYAVIGYLAVEGTPPGKLLCRGVTSFSQELVAPRNLSG